MPDVVPAIDPETLEPVADPYDDAESTPLAESFGGTEAYRAGVLAAMVETGGMIPEDGA